MVSLRKVLWTEGTLLGQQHFQLWEQYFNHQFFLGYKNILPYSWGLAKIEWDDELLPDGILKLTRCTALLNAGRWIDFHAVYDGPLVFQIPEGSTDDLALYLTFPMEESASNLSGYPKPPSPAWVGEYHSIQDTYDVSREREVLLGKQALHLMTQQSIPQDWFRIKILELKYNATQSVYELNQAFIPALINLGASRALQSWLDSFQGKLNRAIGKIQGLLHQQKHFEKALSYQGLYTFSLLQTLVTYRPKILALSQNRTAHPYQIYEVLLGLLGELQGLSESPLDEPSLPQFQQESLTNIFPKLAICFEQLVLAITPKNHQKVALQPAAKNEFHSEKLTVEDLNNQQFYLAVKSEEENLKNLCLSQIKISSPSQLAAISRSFTQGVRIQPLGQNELPPSNCKDRQYFKVDKSSSGWDEIVQEASIAIFVSPALSEAEFELICCA